MRISLSRRTLSIGQPLGEACVPLVTQGINIRGPRQEIGPQAKAVINRTASPFFENDAVRLERQNNHIALL
jgi:hypothetical protein